ncbi:DUF726-domain-containing protein [Auriculariales sp. MPI-PUGE-AT-0066]|nr:DUF726-domain-containing protein [Auriculariales sp. MPI-PUGE-AT-0066]
MPLAPPPPKAKQNDPLWDDEDEGWQDMPVVRVEEFVSDLDAVDREKYHYKQEKDDKRAVNATGKVLDVDERGNEWRARSEDDLELEREYTRLKLDEEQDEDVHLRTKYLFDEDKAMTPLSQMQQTKNLLTDAQRIAYVGVCALVGREMIQDLQRLGTAKVVKPAAQQMELWTLKIMGRLYYHMELETQEQKMIESLAEHGVQAADLVPSLMTTHTVANPEYDPTQAREKASQAAISSHSSHSSSSSLSDEIDKPLSPTSPTTPKTATQPSGELVGFGPSVLPTSEKQTLPGVTTSLDSTDENVTLDIRWTVLCDLFLLLIADSVYDARSRVMLERVASKLSLGWLDVVKFERRVTEALEIQENVEKLEQKDVIEGRQKAGKKRQIAMIGLATIGGGLVIGLSAGLLAPVIGAALGGMLTTIGITGTTSFLAGAGGATIITTGGIMAGGGIAGKGMARRTRAVNTFNLIPLHNNRRVNCIVTVSGFMTGINDDVRLPFSVLEPIVGDVFSALWEPEMMNEMGNALKILTTEVLTTLGQTVLSATVLTAVMSAIQWPLILTKLGYLIDNPWSNALDRAHAAGQVLADILMNRHLGVRPITLIGFSLGARVIFYALVELAKHKAYGIVQDVVMLGATVTASKSVWIEVRSVVAGRFVNGYARSDWVLNYLFRAAAGGAGSVAGLRAVEGVPGLENVDVTDKIAGHTSYRTYMPIILHQLGFPVTADYFDEPEDVEDILDQIALRNEEVEAAKQKKGWFSRKTKPKTQSISRPPTANSFPSWKGKHGATSSAVSTVAVTGVGAAAAASASGGDDDLPQREDHPVAGSSSKSIVPVPASGQSTAAPQAAPGAATSQEAKSVVPLKAGFDFRAIHGVLETQREPAASSSSAVAIPSVLPKIVAAPIERSQSTFPYNEVEQDAGSGGGGMARSASLEPGRRASWSQPSADEDEEDEPKTARPLGSQAMSFVATDGTIWPAPSTTEAKWTPTSTTEPKWTPPAADTRWTPPATDMRWTPPATDARWTPPSTETLSFGGPDGSITLPPVPPKKQWTPDNPWG